MALALSGSKLKERRCRTRHAVMIFALAGSNGPPLWHDPVWLQNHRFAKMCKLLLQKWQSLGVLIFMQADCNQVLFFCMKVQGGTLLIPIIHRTKKMPITMKTLGFQMRTAFVALLASASLGAELGREARSLDMVGFLVLFVKVKFKILMLETVGHQIKVTWT